MSRLNPTDSHRTEDDLEAASRTTNNDDATSTSPLLPHHSSSRKSSRKTGDVPSLYRRWYIDYLSTAALVALLGIWVLGKLQGGMRRGSEGEDRSEDGSDRGKAWPTYPGYAGPTPTGSEPLAVATAYPTYNDISPLKPPPETSFSSSTFNILHHLGNLSPWRTVSHSPSLKPTAQIPAQCKIKQVQLLHRHGARYPTSGGSGPKDFETRVTSQKGFKAKGKLQFLNSWKYKLGSEILTPFGREQLFELGVKYRTLFGELLDAPPLDYLGQDREEEKKVGRTRLMFRTESQDRMTKSSLNFAAGFFGIPEYTKDYDQLVMIEWPGFNCTLSPYMTCKNANDPKLNTGEEKLSEWSKIYLADARKRFQADIEGVELTINDVLQAQMNCAYELVALGASDFCSLFTEEEWLGFEHRHDIAFWYMYSFGQPAQAALGLGWVQEWLARVTSTPFETHNSTTNSTYPFPLDQAVYVDATHDTVISAIITTLKFDSFIASGPPSSTHIPKNKSFIASSISPFAANLHSQIIECPQDYLSHGSGNYSKTKKLFVRWVLNDGIVPLDHHPGCPKNEDGLCELETYVNLTKKRIDGIDWEFDCRELIRRHNRDCVDGD